jgi:hypothetical protein
MKKRILAMLLVVCMLMSMLSVTVWAEPDTVAAEDLTAEEIEQLESAPAENESLGGTVEILSTSDGITLYQAENVAAIEEQQYATLQAAIDAATSGATVKLLADTTESVTIANDDTIILDLNGKTLTAPAVTADGTATGAIQNNGTLEIKDSSAATGANAGTGTITTADQTSHLVYMQTGGTLTITSGNFTAGASSLNSLIWVQNGTVTVNGGVFTGAGNGNNQYLVQAAGSAPRVTIAGGEFKPAEGKYAINANYENTTTITGGTYFSNLIAYDHAKIASGYEVVDNSNGTYTVSQMSGYNVSIGSTGYYDLASAIKAADGTETAPTEITLLADIKEQVTVASGKYITLDLNGHTLTNSKTSGTTITNNGSLTVKDSNTNGAVIGCGGNNSYAIKSTSVLTIKSGSFHTASTAVSVSGGQVKISGGTFTGSTYGVLTSKCTVTITGGEFTGNTAGVFVGASAGATIAGGIFNGTAGLSVNAKATSATITGGTFDFDPTSLLGDNYVAEQDNGRYTVKHIVAKIGSTNYDSLQAAIDAAQDGETVTLLDSVTETSTITISKDMILDLNNKTITTSSSVGFKIASGATVEIKNGKIDATGTAIYAFGTLTLTKVEVAATEIGMLLMNAGEATIDNDSSVTSSCTYLPGVYFYPNTNASATNTPTLNVYGKVKNTNEYFAIAGNGTDRAGSTLNIYKGAEIETSNCIAIYNPQPGTITMSGGTVTGYAGIGIKSGTLTITGGTVQGTANDTVLSDNHSSSGGIGFDGSAIVIDSNVSYEGSMNISISGSAKVESKYSTAIREIGSDSGETNVVSINVTGGTINSGTGMDAIKVREVTKETVSITGGTFSSEPASAYIATDYKAVAVDGLYYVGPTTCIVTFNEDNGRENTTANVELGKNVTKPASDPTKTGYTFAGWYLGDD